MDAKQLYYTLATSNVLIKLQRWPVWHLWMTANPASVLTNSPSRMVQKLREIVSFSIKPKQNEQKFEEENFANEGDDNLDEIRD
ncbi:hypothetical protein KIN20_011604 [Parelaphostrongylus tenuis]|uniref:Uncharacterized protein n=1 Tax=Parelaphostrongylus tenuis TaxID=148309 RepID=A0AAD5QJT5_PARTN|nr:hypothetical protein KIN20_011604 [Parelaphostrongylus tenuis]